MISQKDITKRISKNCIKLTLKQKNQLKTQPLHTKDPGSVDTDNKKKPPKLGRFFDDTLSAQKMDSISNAASEIIRKNLVNSSESTKTFETIFNSYLNCSWHFFRAFLIEYIEHIVKEEKQAYSEKSLSQEDIHQLFCGYLSASLPMIINPYKQEDENNKIEKCWSTTIFETIQSLLRNELEKCVAKKIQYTNIKNLPHLHFKTEITTNFFLKSSLPKLKKLQITSSEKAPEEITTPKFYIENMENFYGKKYLKQNSNEEQVPPFFDKITLDQTLLDSLKTGYNQLMKKQPKDFLEKTLEDQLEALSEFYLLQSNHTSNTELSFKQLVVEYFSAIVLKLQLQYDTKSIEYKIFNEILVKVTKTPEEFFNTGLENLSFSDLIKKVFTEPKKHNSVNLSGTDPENKKKSQKGKKKSKKKTPKRNLEKNTTKKTEEKIKTPFVSDSYTKNQDFSQRSSIDKTDETEEPNNNIDHYSDESQSDNIDNNSTKSGEEPTPILIQSEGDEGELGKLNGDDGNALLPQDHDHDHDHDHDQQEKSKQDQKIRPAVNHINAEKSLKPKLNIEKLKIFLASAAYRMLVFVLIEKNTIGDYLTSIKSQINDFRINLETYRDLLINLSITTDISLPELNMSEEEIRFLNDISQVMDDVQSSEIQQAENPTCRNVSAHSSTSTIKELRKRTRTVFLNSDHSDKIEHINQLSYFIEQIIKNLQATPAQPCAVIYYLSCFNDYVKSENLTPRDMKQFHLAKTYLQYLTDQDKYYLQQLDAATIVQNQNEGTPLLEESFENLKSFFPDILNPNQNFNKNTAQQYNDDTLKEVADYHKTKIEPTRKQRNVLFAQLNEQKEAGRNLYTKYKEIDENSNDTQKQLAEKHCQRAMHDYELAHEIRQAYDHYASQTYPQKTTLTDSLNKINNNPKYTDLKERRSNATFLLKQIGLTLAALTGIGTIVLCGVMVYSKYSTGDAFTLFHATKSDQTKQKTIQSAQRIANKMATRLNS